MRNLIIFIVFFIVAISLNAQSNATEYIKLNNPVADRVSPEAAAVQRYASYPVGHETGIPNITIPLYEIKVGDITLPITLSYHSSGLKPHELSGRIATGWTLNAEPSITRSIRGLDDGIEGPQINNFEKIYTGGTLGFWYNDIDRNRDRLGRKYYKLVADGVIDEEPDTYSYKLATQSGNFYATHSDPYSTYGKTFQTQPYKPITIDGYPHGIHITDETGIYYNFAGGNNYVETTEKGITRLMCKEITSKNTNAKVSFTYQKGTTQTGNYYSLNDLVIIEDDYYNSSANPKLTVITNEVSQNYIIDSDGNLQKIELPTYQYQYNRPSVYIEQSSHLEVIEFDNGKIRFEGYPNITGFKVEDKNGNMIQRVDIYNSLYNPRTVLTKLDSVKISYPSKESKVYRFDYHAPLSVPSEHTKAIDHWGYYNGIYDPLVNDNESTVSSFEASVIIYGKDKRPTYKHIGRDRSSNPDYAKIGILNKITDPNGIETAFTYGANRTGIIDYHNADEITSGKEGWYWVGYDYFNTLNIYANVYVGGLRIERIEEKDTRTGVKHNRSFSYYRAINHKDIVEGWGVVKRHPGSNDYCVTQEKFVDMATYSYTSRIRTWSSNPLVSSSYNNGSTILYSHVRERRWGDNQDIVNDYFFSVPTDSKSSVWSGSLEVKNGKVDAVILNQNRTDENTMVPYDTERFANDAMLEYQYGTLEKQIDYISEADTIRPLLKKEYSYYEVSPWGLHQADLNKILWFPHYYRYKMLVTDKPTYTDEKKAEVEEYRYAGDARTFLLSLSQLKKEKTVEYFSLGDSLVTINEYFYNDDLSGNGRKDTKPRRIKTNINTNTYKEDYFTYGGKYNLNYYYEPLGGLENTLIEHKKILGNDTTYYRNKYSASNNRLELIKTKSAQGPVFDEVLSIKYDSYGNIIETTSRDSISTSYIWSYNNQYLIAKIENITYTDLLKALGRNETTISSLGNQIQPSNSDLTLINNLRTVISNSMVNTYTYKPLVGMLTSADPSGKIAYYEYDSSNRLKRIYFKEKDASGKDIERTIESYEYNFSKKNSK